MTRSPNRAVAYDALRVFAILSVVAIHTLMPYRQMYPSGAPVRVLDDLLHYAVPLFVFISGVFVWGRPLPNEPGAYRRFLRKRVPAIGVPYLFWTAVFLGAELALSKDPGATLTNAPAQLVTGTWYHLYFIPMLLTFYLLKPVSDRLLRWSPELLLVACYLLRMRFGPEIALAVKQVAGQPGWSYATHILTHLPHMALGAWFAVRLPVLPRWVRLSWPVLLAAGTAVLAGAAMDLWRLPGLWQRVVYPKGMALMVLGFALGALALEPSYDRWRHSIIRLAALSFGVYFIHPLFLLAVDLALPKETALRLWSTGWFALAVWAAASAASFGVSRLLASSARTAWMVGIAPLPGKRVSA